MSVTSGNINFLASANMVDTDGVTTGGAINLAQAVTFNDLSSASTVQAYSSSVSDSGNLVVYGRAAAGNLINETLALQGTGLVTSTNTYERLLRTTLSTTPNGVVSLRQSSNSGILISMSGSITGVLRPFLGIAADPVGGNSKTFYSKIFVHNANTTTALLSAQVGELTDGLEGAGNDISFDFESTPSSSQTTTSRLVAPTGMANSFDDTTKTVPNTDILPTGYVATWLKMTVAAGSSPLNTNYQFFVSGSTT